MGRGRSSGGRRGGGKSWIQRDNERYAATQRAINEDSGWSEPVGGGDSAGNPVTASFGSGRVDEHTLLGDGDRSEDDFRNSSNHDHYGSGDGPNDNGTRRGQYSGPGH